ncbi:MAG: hypothetical protein ACREXT_17220, partial [Gammaproteobacteria bacterium]
MKRFLSIASMCLAVVAVATGQDTLVVHEWGTFTTIAGEDGTALEWRPFAATNDLPNFVYEIGGLPHGIREYLPKGEMMAKVRMETPVIYFYSAQEAQVSVKVDFPDGTITEWFPAAHRIGAGIDWGRFRIVPGEKANLRQDDSNSHYYAARETDAAPVIVCGGEGWQYEKFLFYRGVGNFGLPLAVKLNGDKVHVRGDDSNELGEVVVFENSGGNIGYRVASVSDGVAEIERPALEQDSIDAVCSELEQVLIAQGLYEKEAKAMVNTWRDSWFEEGLRVFYVLPRVSTDAVLPITIEPAPAELVRVMVGRVEIITPEVEN